MDVKVRMESDLLEPLIRLQEMDRQRDRLQKKLDEVPRRLKKYTDRIVELEGEAAGVAHELRTHKADADREELEVKSLEAEREEMKRKMNLPGLNNREYLTLQEHLTGVLADINSHSDVALKALTRVEELEAQLAELKERVESAQAEYDEARSKLEGSLEPTKAELATRDAERSGQLPAAHSDALAVYERVRTKHNDALAAMEGTIDRAAGHIGNDLHCSACYMTVTANDAVRVLARKELVQCKSCVRLLYVP